MGKNTDVLVRAGKEAYLAGDYAKAEPLLTQALAEGANTYADVHHVLGVIFHTRGQFTKARAAFEEALRINPNYTEAALNLSITYNDLGMYDAASEVFSSALPPPESRIDAFTRGKIANLHAGVGDAYQTSGLSKEAAVEYRRALGLCPSFVDIRLKLIQALADSGALTEAIEQARLALLDEPKFLATHLHLGLLLHRTGDEAGARKAFETVLELEPNHETAGIYLRMLERGGSSE